MTSTTSDYFLNNNQKPHKNTLNGFKYTMDQDSLSQDLHFKMSKKIAQLTKVIYALNTKNDDNEMTLNTLKQQHSKEIQQILDETSNRVEGLQKKMKLTINNTQQIQELKQTIASYEDLLTETKQKFELFQKESNERTKEKDLKNVEQTQMLNQTIKDLKSSYEQLLDDYYTLNTNMESEKRLKIENLKVDYEKEIQRITEEWKNKEKQSKALIVGSQKEIQIQLADAQAEIQSHIYAKDQLIKDHERQMKEMNDLFDALSAESKEKTKNFEFEVEEYKSRIFEYGKNSIQKESELKIQENQMRKELIEKSTFIKDLELKIQSLEKDCLEKESNISKLNIEVSQHKSTIERLTSEIKSRNNELQRLQDRNEEKSNEMASKIKQIKDLKSIAENLQQKFTEKERELKKALTEIKIMNEESKEMANCSKSETTDYVIQIQTLQRALEELNKERLEEKSSMEKLKRSHEIELLESVGRMKKECESDLEKSNKKREKEFVLKEKSFQDEIQKLKEEFQSKLDEERSKASKIIEKLKFDLDQLKNDLNIKVKGKDKQIINLEEITIGKDKEIKTLSQQLKENKENLVTMKKDNNRLMKLSSDKDSDIETNLKEIDRLKLNLEEQKSLNENIRKNVQIQEDMSEKYNKLSAELDMKWADTLRRETGRLRNDMLESFAKEKQKAIEMVEKKKNNEIDLLTFNFEDHKSKTQNDLSKYETEVAKLKEEIIHLKKLNDSQITEKIQEVQLLLSETQIIHAKEIEKLKNSYDVNIQNLKKKFEENKLQSVTETQSLIESHGRAWADKHLIEINLLTNEHEKKMKMKLDEMENKYVKQFNDQIRDLQTQLSEKANITIDEHKEEVRSLQRKISLLEEQSKTVTNTHRLELERVASAKLKLDCNYQKLEKQLQNAINENAYLKKQIDDFGNDYSRSQQDFSEKLRSQESEIKRNFDQVILNLKMKHEEETKQTITDFNKAQNLYKEKIKELNSRLMEIDEQFVNRPARDEDIEIIQTLTAQTKLYEKEIERLNEEKRFLQLELVNRETNFNKIFNASPNVGILNPNMGAIKTKKINNDKIKSFQKLTPLPGSPFHDDPINPAKPLPPSSRKSFDNS